jgi:hypothetical protein
LLDAGHTILKCSACGNDLVDVWLVKENLPIKSFIRAECAYCGDHSFAVEVHGKFLAGHVSGLTMTDSIMEDFREENGTIIQKVLIKTVRE